MDRFILGDNAFERLLYKEGYISKKEHKVYWAVLNTLKQVEAPDYTVFLDCTVEVCRERVITRGIDSEIKAYTPEFFIKLKECYEEVYNGQDIILY